MLPLFVRSVFALRPSVSGLARFVSARARVGVLVWSSPEVLRACACVCVCVCVLEGKRFERRTSTTIHTTQ